MEKRIWLELTDRDDIGMNTVIACKQGGSFLLWIIQGVFNCVSWLHQGHGGDGMA